MPWGAAIGAAASLGAAGISADQSRSSSNKTADALRAANDINGRLANISEQEWNQYQQNGLPLLKELAFRANQGTDDRTAEMEGKAAAGVKEQYAGGRQALERNLQLSGGRNPGDPGYADILARSYSDESGDTARAIDAARVQERARQDNWAFQHMLPVAQAYQGLNQTAASGFANAGNTQTGIARTSGDMAARANTALGQSAYGLGYFGKQMADWYNTPGSNPNQNYTVNDGTIGSPTTYGNTYSTSDPAYGREGGKLTEHGFTGAIKRRFVPKPARNGVRDLRHRYERRFADGGFVDQDNLNFIRNNNVRTAFDLTDPQRAQLAGTTYANAPAYLQQEAVASRMLSGDPNFAPQTDQQKTFMNMLQQYKNTGDAGYMHHDFLYDKPTWSNLMAHSAGQAPTDPNTGAYDLDWARAEAERLYYGGDPSSPTAYWKKLAAQQPANISGSAPADAGGGAAPAGSGGNEPGGAAAPGDATAGDPGMGGFMSYGDSGGDPGGGDGGDGGGGGPEREGGAITRKGPLPHPASATGGIIRGPGTGTSDSIPTKARVGTYIIPRDVVRAKGEHYFDKLLEKHGVRPGRHGDVIGGRAIRVSNGEYEIPPEVVHREGEEFFNKLLQKYHRPVLADDPDGRTNGGAIKRRELPRSVEDAIFKAIPSQGIRRGALHG